MFLKSTEAPKTSRTPMSRAPSLSLFLSHYLQGFSTIPGGAGFLPSTVYRSYPPLKIHINCTFLKPKSWRFGWKMWDVFRFPSVDLQGVFGRFWEILSPLKKKTHLCQGLNSHYFHIIGDGHQPNSRGLYTHYKDSY